MRPGKQWIHFDAQFPLKFGHDLCERFGPAGELLFIQFLCACKRTYPQGQISYRTEEEACVLLGAQYPFIHSDGREWTLDEFWRWCGARKVTRTKTLKTRKYITATRWNVWEDDRNAKERERKAKVRQGSRRSGAENGAHAAHGRGEVGGVSISPYPLTAPAGDDTTSPGRRGNGSKKPEDPLVDRIRNCVPGTGAAAARQAIERLRAAGVGDIVIDEAAGYAAENGAKSARYVEQVAHDWMAQRDPTWSTNGQNGDRP